MLFFFFLIPAVALEAKKFLGYIVRFNGGANGVCVVDSVARSFVLITAIIYADYEFKL